MAASKGAAMSGSWRIVGVLLVTFALAASAAGAGSHPSGKGKGQAQERVFTLQPAPAGNPEGIAYQPRTRSFFVSITADGAIYRGTPGSDTVAPFIPGAAGKSGVGMKVRGDWLYVAGGTTGAITIYARSTRPAIATSQRGGEVP